MSIVPGAKECLFAIGYQLLHVVLQCQKRLITNHTRMLSGALHIISVFLYCSVPLKPNHVVVVKIQQSRISGGSVPSRQFNFQGKKWSCFYRLLRNMQMGWK